jgi:hypothetical protein
MSLVEIVGRVAASLKDEAAELDELAGPGPFFN